MILKILGTIYVMFSIAAYWSDECEWTTGLFDFVVLGLAITAILAMWR